MKYKKQNNIIQFKAEAGEELISVLGQLCEKCKIKSAKVSGIGGASYCKIGFYDPQAKDYIFREFEGAFEIVSFMGNISLLNGTAFPHVHISIAGADYKLLGGHAAEVIIKPTFEGFIEILPYDVERKFEKESQLNLLDL